MLQILCKGMKTNQVLTRKMGEFDVLQRTSDGYFDGNALLNQWNKTNGNTRRRMDDFLSSPKTIEFINTIAAKESKGGDFAIPDFQVFTKGRVTTNKNGSKIPAPIWMHPFLFIDFAMWINPEFKYNVIKFVHDKLIEYRNDAGNSYKQLSSAISLIVTKEEMPRTMSSVAKAMNYIIYNNHEKLLRNKLADELSLKDLCELQRDVAKLINFGFISSYSQLRNFLRNMWCNKWHQRVLTN